MVFRAMNGSPGMQPFLLLNEELFVEAQSPQNPQGTWRIIPIVSG